MNYRSSFYIYALLITIAIIVVPFIDLNFKRPNVDLLKDFKSVLKNIELLAFLIIVFTSGKKFNSGNELT